MLCGKSRNSVGKEQESGKVSGQGGSLLALLGVAIDNQGTNISENLIKMGHHIQESVERGTNPLKSHKRKYEEDQQAEFQRRKEELERIKLAKQQQERRERVTTLLLAKRCS